MKEKNNQKSVKIQNVYQIQNSESTLEEVFFKRKDLTTKIVNDKTTEALIDSFAKQLYTLIQQGD